MTICPLTSAAAQGLTWSLLLFVCQTVSAEEAASPELSVSPAREKVEQDTTSTKSSGRGSGALVVETDPPGADVYIGYAEDMIDTLIGETPLETDIPAATYYIRLEKAGYTFAIAKLDVRPNNDNWMRIQLTPEDAVSRGGLKIAGNTLLWPGLVAAGTGIGLIVAGNRRGVSSLSKAGYGIAAGGVLMTITGGIILGLTYRSSGVYTMPSSVAQRPSRKNRDIFLHVTKTF
jgi:hypothetical protein